MATNQAAWLDGQGKQLRVATIEVPTPGPDEIVVHNHAVAVNPVDCTSREHPMPTSFPLLHAPEVEANAFVTGKVQDYGIIMTTWPNVIGEDLAGEVYDVGANVTRFKKGDRVLGYVRRRPCLDVNVPMSAVLRCFNPASMTVNEHNHIVPCSSIS